MVPNAPALWECLRNSLVLATLTTLATTLLCLPLALWFARYRFPGQSLLAGIGARLYGAETHRNIFEHYRRSIAKL